MNQKRKFSNYGAKGVAVTIGHRACIPRCPFPSVPKEMGWLWTCRDVPGKPFDPEWRPGAVRKNLFFGKSKSVESIDQGSIAQVPKRRRRKNRLTTVQTTQSDDGSEEHSPAIVISKKDRDITVTLQQMKKELDRHVSDYPYENEEPFCFKLQGKTPEQESKDKKSLLKKKLLNKQQRFSEALGSICRLIYKNIDKEKLHATAAERNLCPCIFLENQVIKYIVSVYTNVHASGSAASLIRQTDVKLDVLKEFVESCVVGVDGDKLLAATSEGTLVSDEEWKIEFTPPCAKYNPRASRRTFKDAEQQTARGRSGDDLRVKSNLSMRNLSMFASSKMTL